jgi:hypothetical protein
LIKQKQKLTNLALSMYNLSNYTKKHNLVNKIRGKPKP